MVNKTVNPLVFIDINRSSIFLYILDLPFRNEMSIRAETHVSSLKSSKDDLEATRKSADQLLRECHITDIIEKKKEKLQELDEACFRSSCVCEPVPFGNMFRELTIPSSPGTLDIFTGTL